MRVWVAPPSARGTRWHCTRCFAAQLVPVAPLRAEYLCIGHALGPALLQPEALCLRVAPSLISLRLGWPLRPVGDATTLRSAAVLSGLRVVHGERAAWAGSTFQAVTHQVKLARIISSVSAVPLVAGVEGFSGPPSPPFPSCARFGSYAGCALPVFGWLLVCAHLRPAPCLSWHTGCLTLPLLSSWSEAPPWSESIHLTARL